MDGDNSPQPPSDSGHWQYTPDDKGTPALGTATQVPPVPVPTPETHPGAASYDQDHFGPSASVPWTASEFIEHKKSIAWYAILAVATIAFSSLVFFTIHDKITTFIIVFVGIVFGFAAARKPRTLSYIVDNSGLTVDRHYYDFGQFRSFAVVDEDSFSSIVFMPLRRFMPLLTVYYDPKDEEKIIGILSAKLPIETHKLDIIENFMRRIRF